MPEPISFGEPDFNLVASVKETHGAQESETHFRILLMGDFSGRTNRGQCAIAALTNLQPLVVDRDNFDTLMKKLGVQIHLSILGKNVPPVCISFSELDDFHPDALYRRLPLFLALKETREGLRDPCVFAAFAKNLLKAPSLKEETQLPEPVSLQPSDDLLDQVIKKSQFEDQPSRRVKPSTQWDSFLHSIIKPHLVQKVHPRHEEMIDAVDTAASELMQLILHHENFQALEAGWRGLDLLVSRLETDSQLKIFILDAAKTELTADLTIAEDLCSTGMYKICVEQAVGTAGGQPWAVIAGNYTFEKQNKDLELLSRMAKIAKGAGTCFISAAGDRFLCEKSLAETPDPDDWQPCSDQKIKENWQALRHLPEAANLGLVLPRMLLRLPYGVDTDPMDAFDFEEMDIPPVHGNYLWGNPCFALILLLGQAFSLHGRQMQPGSVLEINSLPLHVYKEKGESHLKPCAETLLSHRAAEQMMEKGLMPLISFLNQDMVRLGRFQSIADPLSRLAGPWREQLKK
jgi:type VI secretion system protein ImpC